MPIEYITLPTQALIEEQWIYENRREFDAAQSGTYVDHKRLNVAKMITALAEDPVRLGALAEAIVNERQGRVLVLSCRRQQLDALYHLLRVAGRRHCQLAHSIHDAEIRADTDCLFTTYQRQGFNEFKPDVVIYATPSRVKWEFPARVRVVYPIDDHPLFKRIANV